MPIHLYIPMEPFMGTKEQWSAYFNVQQKAMVGYQTYSDMMSIFGLFSIKKNRDHKKAVQDYIDARDNYNKIMRQS